MKENLAVSHLIDPELKNKEWILKQTKYIWEDCKQQNSQSFYHARDKYHEINQYANGDQSIDKYKPIVFQTDEKDEVWVNLNYAVVSLAPKLVDIALANVNKVDFNITATAIDKLAEDEKNAWEQRVKSNLMLREVLGEEMIPYESEEEPRSLEELRIKKDYTYKHKAEVEFEEKFETIANHNHYQETRKFNKKSLFFYGVAGLRERINREGVIKIKPIDIRNIIVPFCKSNSFEDAWYFGEVRTVNLADLLEETSEFSEDEVEKIANEMVSNGTQDEYHVDPENSDSWWSDVKVKVLDIEFQSTNEFYFEERVDKRGNVIKGRTKYGKNGAKKKRYKVWYKASWILESNHIYNYGLCTDLAKRKERLVDAQPSFIMYAPKFYDGKPYGKVQQMIGILDEFMLDYMRLQKVKAEARANGFRIDFNTIENIPLGKGGGNLSSREVLDLFTQRNILLYRSIAPDGSYQPLAPVEHMPGGIGTALMELQEALRGNAQLLYDILGFNDITAGDNVDPRTPVRIGEQLINSTNNALYYIIDADRKLTEEIAKRVDMRFTEAAKKGTLHKAYEVALGKNSIDFVRISPDYSNYVLAIKVEDKPDDLQKQKMEERVNQALAADKITSKTAAIVLNTDNVKVQEMLLGYYEEEYRMKKEQAELAKIRENGQVQAQSNMQAEQIKMQAREQEHNFKMKELDKESMNRLNEIAAETQKELQIKELDNRGKLLVKQEENEGKEAVEELRTDSNEWIATHTDKGVPENRKKQGQP